MLANEVQAPCIPSSHGKSNKIIHASARLELNVAFVLAGSVYSIQLKTDMLQKKDLAK